LTSRADRPRNVLLAALLCAAAGSGACATLRTPPPTPPLDAPHLEQDSGGPLNAEQAAYDLRFVDLALAVDPARKTIHGVATLRLRVLEPLSSLRLDLDRRLDVEAAVLADGAGDSPLAVRRDGSRLWLDLPEELPAGRELEVAVTYGGAPRVAPAPPWDGGFVWSRTPSGEPWIGVSCQLDGADLWWPTKDHPSDEPDDGVTLHFTVPARLTVAANGRLLGVDDAPGDRRTWHWRVTGPINAYDVTFNAAPFRLLARTVESAAPGGGRYPFVFYALPRDVRRAEQLIPELLDHLAFLERHLGPYPFRADKLGFVETPYAAMEHQTIVAHGRIFDLERFGVHFTPLHELSHEWFGNLVSAADWSDLWLHEGFASYLETLYVEETRGAASAQLYLERHFLSGSSNLRPLAPRQPRSMRRSLAVDFTDVYGKGAWVLHTLRGLVGDDVFFAALRRVAYPRPELEAVTDGSQCRSETTEGVRRIFEAASGRDLRWFFEVYLRRAELPRLRVTRRGDEVEVAWEVPGDLPFPMPLEVALPDGGRQRLEMAAGRETLPWPYRRPPVVDPDHRVLRAGLLDGGDD
jgi:aminopeptidase N